MINKNILRHAHHEGFSEEELYGAYKLFLGTLFSEIRLKIINLLRNRKLNVSEITKELRLDQTVVSHNLARLKHHGFLICESEGKYRYYKINKETINPLMDLIDKHMGQYCIHILHSMKGEDKQ
ncbi:MAG: metalloregulator ArsR/SmtB family transcription factor [Nanoarchaeota archaeon]